MNAYLGSVTMAVANHLWQSTIMIGVAWLLTLMLRTNTARTRQRIWMVASLKFLLPFSLLVAAGSHMVHPKPIVQSSPAFYAAMDQWAQPAPVLAAVVQPRSTGPSTSGKGHRIVWDAVPMMLAVVWLCGFAVIVSLWSVRWRRLKCMQRAAIPMPEGRETMALLRVQQRNGTRSTIRMMQVGRQTGRRMEPGVMGVRRQVLLWPDGISKRLSDAQLETILAHEMQHVKHRDNLVAMLHMAVEAVFWFHPLVWWMETRLVEERERACDEEVLRMGSKPAVYAQSILKTCEFCLESPIACVAGVTGGELKRRIAQIMSRRLGRELSSTKRVLLASAAALVVAGPLVFGLIYAQQVRAEAQGTDVVAPKLKTISIKQADGRQSKMDQPSAATNAAPQGQLAWDVVSVHPGDPDKCHGSDFRFTPDGIVITCAPLMSPVSVAYGVTTWSRVIGAPDWTKSGSLWSIDAKVAAEDVAAYGKLSSAERGRMLQPLLAQRFHLKAHMERRDMPVYEAVAAKGGPKLKEATADEKSRISFSEKGKIESVAMELSSVLPLLNSEVGRNVVDKTGLTGKYDITLEYVPAARAGTDETGGISVFTAIEEQLGLKLVPGKVPMDVLVIDEVERPGAN